MAPLSKQLTWDTLLIAFMPVKTFRPLTPSTRYIAYADYSDITKTRPEKSLVQTRKRTGGRNHYRPRPSPGVCRAPKLKKPPGLFKMRETRTAWQRHRAG